jgi:hypothetical protein
MPNRYVPQSLTPLDYANGLLPLHFRHGGFSHAVANALALS